MILTKSDGTASEIENVESCLAEVSLDSEERPKLRYLCQFVQKQIRSDLVIVSVDKQDTHHRQYPNGLRVFIHQSHVVEIVLHEVDFREFPNGIFGSFSFLRKLKIRSCNFIDFTFFSGSYHALQELNFDDWVYHNTLSFKGFPTELPSLKKMNIYLSRVKDSDGFPQYLPKVEELTLNMTRLQSFDNFPKELPSLRTLTLHLSPLHEMPTFPSSLPNLETLDLQLMGLNQMFSFPNSLPSLKKFSLRADKLKITDFSRFPQHLPQLDHFTLHLAEIGSFTQFASGFSNLSKLEITRASILDFTGFPHEFPALEAFIFTWNTFSSYRDLPRHWPALQFLDFSQNVVPSFEGFPSSIPTILQITMESPIKSFYGSPRHLFEYLHMDLSEFEVTHLIDLTPRGMELLKSREFDLLTQYYTRSVSDLATDLVNGEVLSSEDQKRLMHECPKDLFTYLSHHISLTHPILVTIQNNLRIPVSTNDFIL